MNREIDPIELRLRALELRGAGATDPSANDCPLDEQFAAYMDGLLQGEEAATIRKHITQCPSCHFAYRAWQETVPGEGPPVPAHLLEKARALIKPPLTRVVIKFLKDRLELLNPAEVILADEPALEGVRTRGEESVAAQREMMEIRPEIDEIDRVRIQVLEETETVRVIFVPSPDLASERLARLRVDVYLEEQQVQSWPLYAEGTSLTPLERGIYRFELTEWRVADSGDAGMRSMGEVTLDLGD